MKNIILMKKKNTFTLSLLKYKTSQMFKLIEMNKDNIKEEGNNYKYPNDIYGILLKTGTYIHAKDMISQFIIIFFLKRILN